MDCLQLPCACKVQSLRVHDRCSRGCCAVVPSVPLHTLRRWHKTQWLHVLEVRACIRAQMTPPKGDRKPQIREQATNPPASE